MRVLKPEIRCEAEEEVRLDRVQVAPPEREVAHGHALRRVRVVVDVADGEHLRARL